MQKIIGALVLCALFVTPVFCDDEIRYVYKGIEAYNRGDYDTAVIEFWLEIAKYKNPHPHAHYALGLMAEDGLGGMKKSLKTALKYYREAADMDYGLAQAKLGGMYYIGKGVLQNYKEAHKWLLKGTLNRNHQAMGILGMMHYNGHGVEQNDILAHMYFNLANAYAKNGSSVSREHLDRVAKYMTAGQIEEAQRLAQGWMAKNREAK